MVGIEAEMDNGLCRTLNKELHGLHCITVRIVHFRLSRDFLSIYNCFQIHICDYQQQLDDNGLAFLSCSAKFPSRANLY